MSQKHKRKHKHLHSPEKDHPLTGLGGDEASTAGSASVQAHPEKEKRCTDGQEYQKKQLSMAKWLNIISAGGVVVAFFAFLAVVVYACIAHRQLAAMLEANGNNKEQFRLDQRPYIWPTEGDIPQMGLVPNGEHAGEYSWNLALKNFGKTPAINFRADLYVVWGADAPKKVKALSAPIGRAGALLPQGALQFATGYSGDKPTIQDIKEFLKTEQGVIVYGRVDYSDSFGVGYWSLFCEARQSNGVIETCPGYDQMK